MSRNSSADLSCVDTSFELNLESLADDSVRPRSIPSAVYDDLVFYFKYASTAYGVPGSLPFPKGDVLVEQVVNELGKLKGFIVRNDTRKEIVVALRGSRDLEDFMNDTQIRLIPFESPGVSAPEGTLVHSGFLSSWNNVAPLVIERVAAQLRIHEDLTIVTSGHSLGGALSSLAAISLKSNFPHCKIRMYTYGQPRTGNHIYAEFINREFGDNAFRAVHMNDGVPTMVPRLLGYHHHGVEYWQFVEPPVAATTVKCDPDGEDLLCSACIVPSGGINAAHLVYFGIPAGTPFSCEE